MKPKNPLRPIDLSSAKNLLTLRRWPAKKSGPNEEDIQVAFFVDLRDGIKRALQHGSIVATGMPVDTNEIVNIPANFWHYVDLFAYHGGEPDAFGPYGDDDGLCHVKYKQVTVRREDVIRIWPERSKAIVMAANTGAARKECKQNLVLMMRENQEKSRRKHDVWLEFKEVLPRRSFDKAWSATVLEAPAPAWSAPDRPRKSPRS